MSIWRRRDAAYGTHRQRDSDEEEEEDVADDDDGE